MEVSVNNFVKKTRRGIYDTASKKSLRAFIDSEFRISFSDFKWIDTVDPDEIPLVHDDKCGIANIQRINDIQRVNKFLESANIRLNVGEYFLISLETKDSRRTRILNKYPRIISRPYYALDFVLKRVFPKFNITKKLYFWITKGRNRVISFTEAIGRLYSCGFEVLGHHRVGYMTYIMARKTGDPAYDMQPTYGALVKLKRVGKDGKIMDVYKMRTMHPYSEYVQDYVFKMNNLQEGGKIKDDFRITGWGKIFRKLWIDELPMFINYFKREMKLVGVRPLSKHYYSLYPEDVQIMRTKVKPGLIPPFYADLPESLEEIVESERRYLISYLKHPKRTDVKYFFKALYNIFIRRARSN